MKQATNNENRLIQYLLGEMRLEDQVRIEEQYLADPDFHQELRATERDLIDQYVHGELSKAEVERFEKHFLSSPGRRQKVEFARALMQSLARAPAVADRPVSTQKQLTGWASLLHLLSGRNRVWLSAAATVVILVGGWLLISNLQKQNPIQVVQIPQQKPDSSRPPDGKDQQKPPVPKPPEPAPPVQVATFVLTPGLSRNIDETRTLIIAGNVQVNLQLHLETGGYKSYRALIRTAEGDEIWTQDRLKPMATRSGQAIIIKLPASRFSSRDYTIKVSGVTTEGELEEVSSYYFRVNRR